MAGIPGKNSRIVAILLGLAVAGSALAADRLVIRSEGDIASVWRPAPDVAHVLPPYPANLADKSEDVCIGLGYMLNKDGSVSDFSVLKSWGSKSTEGKVPADHFDQFAQSAAAAVMQWRFVPAEGAPAKIKPIYTAATFTFSSNPEADLVQLRDHCVIADLGSFVREAQNDAFKKGNLYKSQEARKRAGEAPVNPVQLR